MQAPHRNAAEMDNALDELLRRVTVLEEARVPVGSILAFAGDAAPPGWLLCNGAAVPSEPQFEALRRVLGTTFDETGRVGFWVPDLRGRFLIGVGRQSDRHQYPNGVASFALAERGGEASHVLSVNEMPTHNHNGTTHGANPMEYTHVHSERNFTDAGDKGNALVLANHFNSLVGGVHHVPRCNDANFPGAVHTHNLNVDPAGGNHAHNNQPPYLALNFIIKT